MKSTDEAKTAQPHLHVQSSQNNHPGLCVCAFKFLTYRFAFLEEPCAALAFTSKTEFEC